MPRVAPQAHKSIKIKKEETIGMAFTIQPLDEVIGIHSQKLTQKLSLY
jgi:hypothetical protein